MRSRRNHKVSGQFAQEQAAGILDGVLKPDRGVRGTANAVMNAVLTAAAQMVSVFASCLQLGQITDQTVRDQLRKRLPKSARGLEDKMNEALRQPLPRGTRRRRRVVSIDLHEIPYHGDTDNQNDLLHKKPRAGTTKFFAYATAFISEQGHRYTLAYTWVRRNESTVKILGRLLAQIERSGVKIRRLLLDRGFFSVAVMSFLKGQNVPFLMPVVFRGRKPKKGKRHTGWRAFLQKNAGWYTHTQRWQKDEVTVRVCVTYKSYRHHRHGKRCQKKLVFAAWRVHGQPTLVREWYRKRFAIEASYRQLGQRASARARAIRSCGCTTLASPCCCATCGNGCVASCPISEQANASCSGVCCKPSPVGSTKASPRPRMRRNP